MAPIDIAQLADRLNNGWIAIEQAEKGGNTAEADRYFARWLDLLADYERAYDERRESTLTDPSDQLRKLLGTD